MPIIIIAKLTLQVVLGLLYELLMVTKQITSRITAGLPQGGSGLLSEYGV